MSPGTDRPFAAPAAASRHQGIPRFGRLVLDVVDRIPAGRVLAYGDIAEFLGEGSPRLVASMMSRYGEEVAWHRVLRADGTCAPEVAARQLPLLRAEATPFHPGSDRVDMTQARWDGRPAPGQRGRRR